MGPHRLQLGDAGGGRETGNLFGVALSLAFLVDFIAFSRNLHSAFRLDQKT